MVEPLRFGIIGLGWVARDYMLPAITAAGDRVRLTAVVSLRAADFAGLPNDVACCTELDARAFAQLVDAVYIATPNHLHEEQAIACLRAGIHVLCEKPLALSAAAVARMRDAAVANNRLLVTAYDQRHHPAHRRMHDWLRAGRLGTITQARVDYACWLPAAWSADNWRIDYDQAGGGAVIDLAPHGIDLLEWLLGDAVINIHCFLQSAVQDYAVDDGGVLSLRFASGSLATLTVAYNRPETLPRRRLEIIGTSGILLAENTMGQDPGGTLVFTDAADGKTEEIPFAKNEGPFHHQLIHFLQRIRSASADNEELNATLRQVKLLEQALVAATIPTAHHEIILAT